VDTDRCDGCGDCLPACPAQVFELVENEFDLDALTPLAAVKADHSKKLKYSCGPCKPAAGYVRATAGPIVMLNPGVYPADIEIPRDSIAHILEHAGIFIGYNCKSGDSACDDVVLPQPASPCVMTIAGRGASA
jgi:ferredoxin